MAFHTFELKAFISGIKVRKCEKNTPFPIKNIYFQNYKSELLAKYYVVQAAMEMF